MDTKTVRLWIGTAAKDNPQIVVSAEDYARILGRGLRNFRPVEVTDLQTGKKMKIRRASCGLPRCLCALEFVNG